MPATRKFQRLVCALLIVSTSLALAPVSSTQAASKVFIPAVANAGSEDKCIAEQLAEPSEALDPNCPPPGSSAGVARADYNGDGFSDLTVGIPRKDIGRGGTNYGDAGAVSIIYGTSEGLSAFNNQFWSADSPNVSGEADVSDYFGSALAAGNFNGDKYSDLAIGIPGKDLSGAKNAGAVQILYGSATGLTAAGNQFWIQGQGPNGTLLDKPEQNDDFGSSLAWGDFNHDGYGDLAVGIPHESIVNGSGDNIAGTGAVQILYGSANGLVAAGNQFWHQESPGIIGANESNDQFGYTLAGGDFNGDHFADLVIGVPDEDITSGSSTYVNAGAVNVIYGGTNGLAANNGPDDEEWDQGSGQIQGSVETGDHFGMSLAVGDFDHDGNSDLAVGVPYEDVGDIANAGAVNIIFGSTVGLRSGGNQIFDQDSSGDNGEAEDVAEPNDLFGAALAAGDFNGDGFQDLAIGVPLEDNRFFLLGAMYIDYVDSGGINLLTGTTGGLKAKANNFLFPANLQHPNAPAWMDFYAYFGKTLTAWNFGKGGRTDLAIGSTGGKRYDANYQGVVGIFYGPLNEDSTNNETWSLQDTGILGSPAANDQFGLALY